MSLFGKQIVLGISGGIAAYKSADLTRRLRDAGAEVRVVMTRAATEFVTSLTFQALSGNPVHTALLDPQAEAAMGHIELARWADVVLIAPASADFMAKLAHGLADDLLSTLCLATDAPIALAPAMNRLMWSNPATRHNVAQLKERGLALFGPGQGSQACGEQGEGRMLEPLELVDTLSGLFNRGELRELGVMITAGPTHEAIDPVRYITNRSSGKMGFALAEAALEMGAAVKLISGPVALSTPRGARRIEVESAQQMHDVVMDELAKIQIFIACAAVADYRPVISERQKIKKKKDQLILALVRTPDILATVAGLESPPFTLGFAAETRNLEEYARGKLKQKSLDMIAANWVGAPDSGFESEYNALEVYWTDGQRSLPKAPKQELARQLIQLLTERYAATHKGIVPQRQTHRRTQDPG
ncbi:MAG: bifunctional phosphopantothenoylcysteine decarboxylase/phosphopantothenate--cysteine ligase CoaBC [Gammaproteobacteria bacterium]|nr:bifunctional phosphopantothenoylcysteine decarboxylase/phosphopantothenate--cysteine ligase CoaBC [Gammaproteobacteria bacterium]